MSTTKLKNALVAEYSPDLPDFGQDATKRIEKHFAELPKSRSKIDPDRLGSKATMYSQLRALLLEKAGPIEIDGEDQEFEKFNNMTAKEQYKFQQLAKKNGEPVWVMDLDIMPSNLEALQMPKPEMQQYMTNRKNIDTAKLRDDKKEVDGTELVSKLITPLEDLQKWPSVVSGLLLATGRRKVEVMKTGEFYLAEDMKPHGYEAMFSGQAKPGLQAREAYRIPLLAPFNLIERAVKHLRDEFDTTKLTEQDVAQKFGRGTSTYCQKQAGLHPHELRSIYAISCYDLSKTKMSLMGYISQILGHSETENAAYYQRIAVKNPTRFKTTLTDEMIEEDIGSDWNTATVPQMKRLQTILEMMRRRLTITASAVRRFGGGTMSVIEQVIELNREKIDRYNSGL